MAVRSEIERLKNLGLSQLNIMNFLCQFGASISQHQLDRKMKSELENIKIFYDFSNARFR